MIGLAQQSTESPDLGWFHALQTSWTHVHDQWGPMLSNLLLVALLAALVGTGWAVLRVRYWRNVLRVLFASTRARVSFAILCLYLLVAVLDSIAWRDPALDAQGQPVQLASGRWAVKPQWLTVLDRLDRMTLNLAGKDEGRYSSPLARREFVRRTVTTATGQIARVRPPLNFAGQHPLGTDQVGTDVLYKALKGVRTALVIGGLATVIAIPFAIFFGIQAGYCGRWVDDLITYLYSTLASIPSILLIIAFVLTFGRGLVQLCLIMGVMAWTGLCRLIRGEVLKVREMDYVQAARAIGAGALRIQIRHILPNVMHLVVIRAVLMFSGMVLAEVVLSYLNVGVGEQTHSWGTMINQGRFELSRQPVIWWNLAAAFVLMFGLVLPANIFGDAVRDALDPRLAGSQER